jgi:hypothetical protein
MTITEFTEKYKLEYSLSNNVHKVYVTDRKTNQIVPDINSYITANPISYKKATTEKAKRCLSLNILNMFDAKEFIPLGSDQTGKTSEEHTLYSVLDSNENIDFLFN